MTWLVAVVGLLFLVLIHEAGHFFVALAVRMRPRKFYIGFPPAIAKVKRRGIEYGIGAIPLGGYVRIPGMHRPAARDVRAGFSPAVSEAPALDEHVQAVERSLEADDQAAARSALDPLTAAVESARLSRSARKSAERGLRDLDESLSTDAYWRQATWKRIAVIFAGPAVNILFAIGLLALVYAIGSPNIEAAPARVASVQQGSPAAAAGLHEGDVIVAVDGRSTPTFATVHDAIVGSHGEPIAVTVRRDHNRVTLPPRAPESSGGTWLYGFVWKVPAKPPLKSYSVVSSVRLAAEDCWQAIIGTAQAIGGLFHSEQRSQLTSTVGIVEVSHQALEIGFRTYLRLLGFISLALAILNLLPLLPLDGGHILFSAIEGIRRRAVAREVYERASVIGFALLMLVFFIALNNDIGGNGPG